MDGQTKNKIRTFLRQLNVVRTRIGVDQTSEWMLNIPCPHHGMPRLDVQIFHGTEMTVRGLCCEDWIQLLNNQMIQLPNEGQCHD